MKMSPLSRRWTAALAAVLTLPLALPALAAPHGGDFFEKFDLDGDGTLSQQELTDARLQNFDRIDTDANGLLSPLEIEAARETIRERLARRAKFVEQAGEQLKTLDRDGDGNLSRDEFLARPTPLLTQSDRDGDGSISREEMETTKQFLRERFREQGLDPLSP